MTLRLYMLGGNALSCKGGAPWHVWMINNICDSVHANTTLPVWMRGPPTLHTCVGSTRAYSSSDDRLLYPTHIPLHPIQRGAVALGAAIGALLNPARADLVAALGETTGHTALVNMRDRMRASESGRAVLKDRPRVTNAAVAHAFDLPVNTFGGQYAKFMGDRDFVADDRPPVRFIDDEELAYVATRAREVHDFWHVLFNCHTNVLGELALKAVEFVQTGMPMTALSVAGAQYRLKPRSRAVLRGELLPWAYRAGTSCEDLMCLYYEKHFEEDIEDVRLKWRILPAPPVFGAKHRSMATSAVDPHKQGGLS